jgi:hypothetical protein
VSATSVKLLIQSTMPVERAREKKREKEGRLKLTVQIGVGLAYSHLTLS